MWTTFKPIFILRLTSCYVFHVEGDNCVMTEREAFKKLPIPHISFSGRTDKTDFFRRENLLNICTFLVHRRSCAEKPQFPYSTFKPMHSYRPPHTIMPLIVRLGKTGYVRAGVYVCCVHPYLLWLIWYSWDATGV